VIIFVLLFCVLGLLGYEGAKKRKQRSQSEPNYNEPFCPSPYTFTIRASFITKKGRAPHKLTWGGEEGEREGEREEEEEGGDEKRKGKEGRRGEKGKQEGEMEGEGER
jgi:hypothetical protein